MHTMRSSEQGFTLIELLIVIVIIGILAGVVLAVINPAQQQLKANQSVLRSSTEKMCLALQACGTTTTDANQCDTKAEAGITVPAVPVGASYFLSDSTNPATSDSSANVATTATVAVRGALGTCTYDCNYNFASATPSAGMTMTLCAIK